MARRRKKKDDSEVVLNPTLKKPPPPSKTSSQKSFVAEFSARKLSSNPLRERIQRGISILSNDPTRVAKLMGLNPEQV